MVEQRESKTRLILHVGTHKTGTSYLQKLFFVNRQFLADQSVGLATPLEEGHGSHHQLVAFLDQGAEGIQRFIAGLNSGHSCTIFSSEVLLTWLLNSPQAAELSGLLVSLYDVTVVLYLRRQDYMKESVFAEVATSWYQGDILDECHYGYDYGVYVDRLVELFGVQALRVGVYRDDRRQDLGADFLALAGLEHLIGRLVAVTPVRVSANRRQVALLALFPKDNPDRFERLRRMVLAPGQIVADSSKYQLSPEQRQSFLEPYIDSNRRLAQEFVPDAEDYLVNASPVREDWSPVAPYSVDEVASLLQLVDAGYAKRTRLGLDALDDSVQSFLESSDSVVLLHDGALQSSFVIQVIGLSGSIPSIIDVRCTHPSALELMPPNSRILYACVKDDLGLQFLNLAYSRGMQVQPASYGDPRDYLCRNVFASHALHAEIEHQQAGGYLELEHGIDDYAYLIQAYEAVRERSGWIVEVGCSGGSSAGALLAYVGSRQQERGNPEQAFHFMDAFGEDGSHGSDAQAVVGERIHAYGRDKAGIAIEVSRSDVISDPIPEAIVSGGVRLLNIALESYEEVAAALDRYAPLIVPGGIMICERAGHTPQLIDAYRALEDFMASEAARAFCRLDLASGQSFLVRSQA